MIDPSPSNRPTSGYRKTSGHRVRGKALIVSLLVASYFAILLIVKSAIIPTPRDLIFLDHRNVKPFTKSTSSKHSLPKNETDQLVRQAQFVLPLPKVERRDTENRNYTLHRNKVDDRDTKNNDHPQNHRGISVCFVSSQFSSTKDKTDHLYDVRQTTPVLHESPLFHFFAFSNLADLKAPGWKVVVKDLREYDRWITQSRWAKFMAFRDATIKETCQVVFYIDGILSPKNDDELFQTEAKKIMESNVKFAQRLHPVGGGAEAEFDRIRLKKKDIKRNVAASLQWLREQPDYNKNCTLYENSMFGYAIDSIAFQKSADFFWNHYSKEQDSWRDQPLWCYTLHHFGITPLQLTGNGKDILFDQEDQRTAKGSHKYKSESVISAANYYESLSHMVSLANSCWLDSNSTASNSSLKPAEITHESPLTPVCPDQFRRAMAPTERTNPGLTISIPYSAQPALLLQQLRNFATYPKNIQTKLNIIVVDNGSPSGLRAMDHLNISTGGSITSQFLNTNQTGPAIPYHYLLIVVRVNHNIDWNEEGSHNLAFYLAKTKLGLILDIRMLVPMETIRDVFTWETTRANNETKRNQPFAHKFNRMKPNGERKHQQTCALVEIPEFWNSGGMDEDFSGNYGYGTSPHFWHKWEQGGRATQIHDSVYLLEQETKACDSRWLYSSEKVTECKITRSNMANPSKEGKRNRKLWKEKSSGKRAWLNAYLRFNWTLDF